MGWADPRRDDTVVCVEEGMPTTLNPLYPTTMVDHRVHQLLFNHLIEKWSIGYRNPLVQKYDKLEDGKKFVVHLKEGVIWHDGEPFTPADICFTVSALLDPKTDSVYATPLQGTAGRLRRR